MSKQPELPSPPIRRLCPGCHKEKVLGGQSFLEDPSQPDGYSKSCKQCLQEEEVNAFNREVAKQVALLDKSSLLLLQKIAESGGISSVSLPHAATLLEDIITVWGGSMGFAQHMLAEFLAARPGSMARLKHLTAILNLVKFVSAEGYVQPELEQLSDDELKSLKKVYAGEDR